MCSCHLFLISSASVRSVPFLSGIVAGSAHEAGHAADISDNMPGVIAVKHLDQDIAGIDLTLVGLAHAGLGDLCNSLHRDGDGQDLVMQGAGLDGLLDGGLYSIFVTGVGMDNIPLCSFCHSALP